jgi:hypothetical protein
MPSIEGARVKLARAQRHLAELQREVNAYLASSPFALEQSEDESKDLVYRIRILKRIPQDWSAIVGDAVHNMRSALDLLAWQLVLANGTTPSRSTSFPISQARAPDFYNSLERALQGASGVTHRFVRRLKPYRGGNLLLYRLHALDISDKHKLILIVGAAQKHVVLRLRMAVPWLETPVEVPPLALKPADRQFPVADGAEVFRVKAAAREAADASDHQVAFELAFGDVEEVAGLPLLQTLSDMHGHVSRIVSISERWLF